MFYNLVHLQSAVKKDPAAYREEFLEQFNRFGAALALFKQNPSESRKDFQDLLLFVGHLAALFAKENEAVRAVPATLCELLRKHKTVLQSDVRTTFCRAIMLFRSRGLLTPIEVHSTFFDAFVIRDRELRKMLFDYLVNDVKTLNRAQKSAKVNAELRAFLRKVLQNETGTAARMALALLIALYRKGVWRDEAVVNMIAECCFARCSKLVATALRFFLKAVADDDAAEKGDSQSDSDDQSEDERFDRSEKQLRLGYRVGRKTSKREKRLERRLRKLKNKKNRKGGDAQVDYGVLYSLNDPQTFCERLFRSLESCRERFRLRVAMMSLISRLIAVHKLIVLNFYPFTVRYLQPRQLFVTRILVYAAQACHEHVPPDSVQLLLNTICKNFITERNSSEAITVGINTVREICARCPYGISTELLNDLCTYKNWKKDRTVNAAARSLISLYRDLNPSLLERRHRGKPTEAQAERIEELAKAAGFNDTHSGESDADDDEEQPVKISKQPIPLLFGASSTLSHIPGSEALEAFQRGNQASTATADMDDDDQDEPWNVSEADSDDDQIADESCEEGEQEENESAATENEGDSNNDQDSDDDGNGSQNDSECDDESDNEDENESDEEAEESDNEKDENGSEEDGKERMDKHSKVQSGPPKAKRRRVDSDPSASAPGPTQLSAAERARELLCSRILTDAEFDTIRRVQTNKEITFTSARKRKANDGASDDEDEDDDDEAKRGNQFVRLSDIASVAQSSHAKLVGLDKRSRAASIKREKEEQRRAAVNPARKKGRRGREKPMTASRSNAEQRKSKPFMMVRPKLQRKRAKRSFREKQSSFRKSLMKRMQRAK